MLHQPTPRTDLMRWAMETTDVIGMIEAKVVVVSDPFMPAVPVLDEQGIRVLTVEQLLASAPIDPLDTDDDDLALMQLTSGSTGMPKAVCITHANIVANAEAMFIGANFDPNTDVIVSWLPCFHDMGMTGFLTVPMYFGAELVKVTPMDFLHDILLWAKLIDKYKGTMTAAPNFAYNLLAKRLRRQATAGQFDLSSLRWALSGAEQVDPADVEDLCEAGAPFGLKREAIVPAYGMAETTVAVSFSECGAGMVVDEIDADLLAVLHRAVPVTKGNTRRLVCSRKADRRPGGAHRRRGQRRAAHPRGRRHPGSRQARHQGLHHDGRLHRGPGRHGLVRHRRHGIPHRDQRHRRLRPGQGRHHHGREEHLPDRHRTRRHPRGWAFVRDAPSRSGSTPACHAKPSQSQSNPTITPIPSRCVGSSVRWPTRSSRVSPSGLATSWCFSRA